MHRCLFCITLLMVVLCSSCERERTTGPRPEFDTSLQNESLPDIKPKVAAIVLSEGEIELEVGQKRRITAEALDAEGQVIDGVEFEWASIGERFVHVSGDGMVTAKEVGRARVFCKCDDMVSAFVAVETYRIRYANSFERDFDTVLWSPNSILSFADEAAPGGGERSLKVDFEFPWPWTPTSECELPGPARPCYIELRAWSKVKGCGPGLIYLENVPRETRIYTRLWRNSGWISYRSSECLFLGAQEDFAVGVGNEGCCFHCWDGITVWIDRLEVREVPGPQAI